MRLIPRDGGDEAGHLQGSDEEKALANRGVGGVSRDPTDADPFALPSLCRHDEATRFIGHFDSGLFMKAKTFRLGTDHVDAAAQPFRIVEDVAAAFDRGGPIDLAVAVARVATEDAVSDPVNALAVMCRLRVDRAVTQARDRGEQLEGGARRVGQLQAPVEPGACFIDPLKGRPRDEGATISTT